ncbi:MAG: 16S rRNA (adenine(1518)-N(6)/adenine(1519)-N(6))-dimethyltransferase RsmA [Clostridia bacterium]|nr:16S rRNA (adenine(1518)-N(6)/adenine(1519)-N(6))-dimethyltransferase RsmA [Clostridia bacterium]
MEYIATKNKTKEVMDKYEIFFKKKFGQNFLIDKNIIEKIISSANVTKDDVVIEVGPGIGNMTQYLATASKKVIAIEIDKDLVEILKNDTLKDFDNVEVISSDILKLDLDDLFNNKLKGEKIKVVSNLPYYITTPIIMELLNYRDHIESITIMIQKEVADRINAKPKTKDYGSLSIAIGAFTETTYVTTVPHTCFIPEPNVDSAVIKIDILDKPKLSMENVDFYFEIVRAAFSQRRKTLVNTLYSAMNIFESKTQIENLLEELGFEKTIRGEALSIEEFETIAMKIEKDILKK